MGLFRKKPMEYATLSLNLRLDPKDRVMFYEKVLDKILKKNKIGVVDGGGTMFSPEEGPLSCDVNIDYYKDKEDKLIELLKQFPFTKGSKLILGIDDDEKSYEVGEMEGLALYLNGTELDKEVYETCDLNIVLEELYKILKEEISLFGMWHGNKETALYFYGKSYESMKALIEPFVSTYPLCQKCRIEQLA